MPDIRFRGLVAILLPFAAGYFLSYLYRVINGVLAANLSLEFSLSAADLGLLTATYFITFSIAQIPVGLSLDMFGARKTECCLLLIAAGGAAIFAYADSFSWLVLGRCLIGLGVAACLMAPFKYYAGYFPAQSLPLIYGIHMCSGGLGAYFGTKPIHILLQWLDWRDIFILLSVITLCAAMIIWRCVPEEPNRDVSRKSLIPGLSYLLRDKFFWKVTPIAAISQATMLAMQGLWAGLWMRDVANLGEDVIATTLSQMMLALIAGYLLLGFITHNLASLKIPTERLAIWVSVIFIGNISLFAYIPAANPIWWCTFSLTGSGTILFYSALNQYYASRYAGRVNTLLNMLVFSLAFLLQWGFGVAVEAFHGWGSVHYSGYVVALSILILLNVIAAIWFFLAPTSLQDKVTYDDLHQSP